MLVLTSIGVGARLFFSPAHLFVFHEHLMLAIWGVWDTGWYVHIAEHGYSAVRSVSAYTLGQADYAFFPLYPLLMWAMGRITQDVYIAGLLISNSALVVLLWVMLHYIKSTRSTSIAIWTVVFLILSPCAFILRGVFTESLYLLCVVSAFFFASQRRWMLVGVVGMCAALTRSVGVLLIIPMVIEYMSTVQWDVRRMRANMLWLMCIPFGFSMIMLMNTALTGDPFAFVHVQAAWGRGFDNPMVHVWSAVYYGDTVMRLNAFVAIGGGAMLVVLRKRLRLSEFIFGMYSILIPLCTGVESMARYVLVIFPIYILFAQYAQIRWVKYVLVVSLCIAQSIGMVLWTLGYDVMK